MQYMFQSAGYSATNFDISFISNWDVSNVKNMSYMFRYAGYNSETVNFGDLSNWNTSKVTNMRNMFNEAGKNATTWNGIGALKVYASNITSMFDSSPNAKATLNIYSNPSNYTDAFKDASTVEGSGITVNYKSTTTNIDNIIATKSDNSNVVKGSQLD